MRRASWPTVGQLAEGTIQLPRCVSPFIDPAESPDARLELWTGRRLVSTPELFDRSPLVDVPRLAWWPGGKLTIAPGSSAPTLAGFASSRLPRALDLVPEVFRRLRRAIEDAAERGDVVALVEEVAASEPVRRAARRADLPRIHVQVASDRQSLDKWLRERRKRSAAEAAPPPPLGRDSIRLELSPPLADDATEVLGARATLPAADRVLAALVGRLHLLSLRRGGNWELLLGQAGEWPEELRPSVRRWNEADERETVANSTSPPVPPWEFEPPVAFASIHRRPIRVGDVEPGEWLAHFTRRCDGPWPGQASHEYWDELLDERPERDRSAEATLARIVRQERLRGSTRTIRGAASVVCFTAVSWAELARRRTWRRHRRRWDFEPYGVAVRREALVRRGARPVVYGDEATWRSLTPAERPFFQARGRSIDWRDEQEWRAPGDVDLRSFAPDEAVVFTPDRATAERIGAVARFRVVILADS